MKMPHSDRVHPDAGAKPSIRATLKSLSTLVSKDWFESRAPNVDGAYYGERSRKGIAPRCDLWKAQGGGGGSVVLVHGGGFIIGHKRMKAMRLLATHFADHGAHVCSIDYRMLGRGGRLDEAVDDVASALSWWATDPMGWGVHAGRITMVSLSAGGALMMLAAGRRETPVARLVGVFGIYDFRSLGGRIPAWIATQLVGSRESDVIAGRSPRFSPQPAGDVLLIHGTADKLVPVEQAHGLAAERSSQGLSTTLSIYDGAPHAFLNWAGPLADRALAEMDAFLAPILQVASESEAA